MRSQFISYFYPLVFVFSVVIQSHGNCHTDNPKYWGKITVLNELTDHILYKAEEAGMPNFTSKVYGDRLPLKEYLHDYNDFKRCFSYHFRSSDEWFTNAIQYNIELVHEFQMYAEENRSIGDLESAQFLHEVAIEKQKLLNILKNKKPIVQNILHDGWNTIQQQWVNLLSVSDYPKDPFLSLQKAFILFDIGKSFDAILCIENLIENEQLEIVLHTEEINRRNFFAEAANGYSEIGQYEKSIECLNKAIKEDPKYKKLYLDRATAYFELGNFDLCLNDYLRSKIKPTPIQIEDKETFGFASGLTKGILKGTIQAGTEYVPSMISSLQGIGHGLWSFAQDPVNVSLEFVQALETCIEFVKSHTAKDVLNEIIPELKDLFQNWNQYERSKQGEIAGSIIGKYGVDIFAGAGIAKGVKAYRALKKANNLLTYEGMAISKRNLEIIQLEACKKSNARKEFLKSENLKIEADKQGKHIIGHKNYDYSMKKSIFKHENPKKLIDDFAGTGTRVGNRSPGTAGYQEIVNFKEFIGFSIDRETGEKISTCWGKIHYSENGVHIVPTKPRG